MDQPDSSLCGLRYVKIPRSQHGFGFTLRHFIIYPPDLYNNNNERDAAAAAIERHQKLGKVTEPVDTIFVKSVREHGSAAHAGLCVGDRIVSVNGERIVGKSYDQVVHLIQKSAHNLYLEVSPKQYDTLQLFYEDKAYRPETNQRPHPTANLGAPALVNHNHRYKSQSQSLGYFGGAPNYEDDYQNNNASHESFFVDPSGVAPYQQQHRSGGGYQYNYQYIPPKMSSNANTNQNQNPQQQQFLSHLPRPTPYKSSNTSWSHLSSSSGSAGTSSSRQPQSRFQPQSYYPFQKPEFADSPRNGGERAALYGIREEAIGTKSAESVLGGTPAGATSSAAGGGGPGNRYGSMECLPSASPPTWKNSPGYRFSISTGPEEISNSSSEETFRRESTISLEGSTSTTTNDYLEQTTPTHAHAMPSSMYVTMSGSNEINSDAMKRISAAGHAAAASNSQFKGYEGKMAERIRKSCEQKEEFLRRPNQPLQWVPSQGTSPATGFPKEFYAQPQKFQKVPWPPENKVVLVSTTGAALPGTAAALAPTQASDNIMTVTMREKPSASGPHRVQIDQLRNHSASLDETTNRKQESLTNRLRQQMLPKSSVGINSGASMDQPTWTVSDYGNTVLAKNRLTVVGGGKLHCDPPKDWVPSSVLDEYGRSVDPSVILRKRETDLDDNDRLVRRVSYLKATSSPIDMDRKNASSPTTPTKSPTSEFRNFGVLVSAQAPDNSEVIRDGQVHFKVRAGDAKKGGYYRSWRAGWAQVRRSGCLYLSKEKFTKDAISGGETDVILCISLKDGVVEAADDYTKRKYVVRIKTSSRLPPSTTLSSPATPSTIPVEILLQIDDPFLQLKWIQTLQQQQDNNNYANSNKVIINPSEMSSPKSSLLRSLLQAPNASGSPSTSASTSGPYLSVAANPGISLQGLGGASPKNKTWKGKVARQWKKMHKSGNSSTGSFGHGSVAESGATFGVLLEDCPVAENSLVPKVLEFCVETVEERGLSMVGIYRIPGNNAAVGALTESLNKGNEPNPEQDPRWKDVHVISSLLKSFLRKLPDPLLTSEHYPEFIEGAADPNPDKALERIRSLIHDLPDPNYETLRYLIYHLRKVADHSEKNRMESRNLAIVFGPTVVRTCEENVASLVNDMQHQCKIMELLINNVDEIFKEKENDSPTPEDDLSKPVSVVPAQPRIESEIKASLLQAAQRKVLKQAVQPIQNVYGLPSSNSRTVDESGLIRSYAGLGEETEQRVKQFEMETRALLHRDARSPVFSNSTNYVRRPEPVMGNADPMKEHRMRVEAEWKRAKDDLENEDFYDQLADNPSSIVEHRDRGMAPFSLTSHNLSSSSISSTNSGGPTVASPYGISTWPVRLGPTPFKPQTSNPSLPPKPPHHSTQRASTISSTTPAKPMNSSENLNLDEEDAASKQGTTERVTLKRLKNFESSLNYDSSKAFGSLDSLRDIANGSREDLSAKPDETDLMTSTTTTDNKSELQPNDESNDTPTKDNGTPPNHCNGVGSKGQITQVLENVIHKVPRRTKSLINRRKSDINSPTEKEKELTEDSSLDRAHISGSSWSGPLDPKEGTALTKEAKTVSNKLKRECRRRHSLNGTADILRLMFGSSGSDLKDRKKKSAEASDATSSQLTTTMLSSNNILESHV